jgi:phage terminase small subunit
VPQKVKSHLRDAKKTKRPTKAALRQKFSPKPGDPNRSDLPPLNDQHQKFCAHYVICFNAAESARQAGFSEATARSIGHSLLTRADIQAHVRAMRAELGELHFDLANRVTAQLIRMASADPTKMLGANGDLTDPATWAEEEKSLIVGLEIEEKEVGEGAEFIRTKKVKLESRKGVLDSLAKITGQFIEKRQMLGKDGLPADPVSVQPIFNVSFDRAPSVSDIKPKRTAKAR